jgi:hypothetical protein
MRRNSLGVTANVGARAMTVSTATDIRAKATELLRGDISFDEFQLWSAPVIWDIDQTGIQQTIDLAYDIELLIAEQTNDHWTWDQFRDQLAALLRTDPASPPA